MSLRRAQELFYRAITWPTGVTDFLEQSSAETVDAFHRLFAETPSFSRNDRVEVYAEAYFWRLAQVLAEQFPITRWLAKKTHWHNLVTDYVLARPSVDPDIGELGKRFPTYVRGHGIGKALPHLGDVADVDWTLTEVIDGPDEPLLTRTDLQSIPPADWPDHHFRAAWTTRVHSSLWDISALWQASQRADDPTTFSLEEHDPPTHLIVWRNGYEVTHRRANPPEASALRALVAGDPFTKVCTAATEQDPGITAEAVARWIVHNALHGATVLRWS